MKTQILRLVLLIFWVALLPKTATGQSITQINSLTAFSVLSQSLPEGFFTANRGNQSTETNNLYFTNGTAAGTVQLTQSPVGFFANRQGIPALIGKTLFFVQADGVYKTDGTAGGTVLVKALTFSNPGLSQDRGIVYKNQLFFKDDALNIWKTDGTTAGTVLVKSKLGFDGVVLFQDKLYFTSGNTVYSSDSTESGTQPVKTFTTGDFPNTANIVSVSPSKLIVNNGYYTNSTTQANQVYISDGTPAGTVPITTATTPTLQAIGYSAKDNLFYFSGGDKMVWQSDGTPTGTVSTSIASGGTFLTNDGLYLNSSKLYKIVNGQAIDLLGNTGYTTNYLPDAAGVANVFAYINGVLYFNAAPQSHNNEIWRSDGTVNGTYSLSTADDKATGRFVRTVFTINNTVYLSESIQKTITIGQTNAERGQITRIEKSGDKDVQKVVLADQEVNLNNVSTITNGKAFCAGFTATNVFKAVAGFYLFDPGAAPVQSCSLTIAATTPTTIFCTGTTGLLSASVTGGTAPLTYQWSQNGTPISGATSATYSASAAGSYAVTVTDSKTCTATSSVLTISVVAPPASVTATNTGPYDAGQTVQLNASGGSTYAWKGPNGFTASIANPTISNATTAQAGSYSVTVGTSPACPTSTAITTVVIRGALLPPTIAASQSAVCAGSSTILTAQGCAGTVRWSSGQTGASITVQPAAPTTYTAVCDADGRSSAISNAVTIGVIANPAIPTITSSSSQVVGGSSVTLAVGAGTTGSLQWLLGDSPIAGATQPAYVTTQAGMYSIRVTNVGGCTAVSSMLTINLVTATEPINPLTDNQVTVFPNPTTGECWVTIDVSTKQPVTLYVVDALGKSVSQWIGNASPKMQPIRVSLPNGDGVYLLRIETEKTSVVKKVVHEK